VRPSTHVNQPDYQHENSCRPHIELHFALNTQLPEVVLRVPYIGGGRERQSASRRRSALALGPGHTPSPSGWGRGPADQRAFYHEVL